MKTKLTSDQDELAIMQVCGLFSARSPAALLAAMSHVATDEEDFEVIIKASRLAPSFRSNPSLFSKRVLEKCPLFEDSAGFFLPRSPGYVSIILFRRLRTADARRYHPDPSVLQVVKNWLKENLPKDEVLEILLDEIPRFFFTHPEQLAYRVYRETQTRITITKLKTKWKISRR